MLQIISLLIVVVVSSVLGLISYYNNPKNATNRMVGIFSLTMIFWAFTMYLTIHSPQESMRLFLIRLSMLAAILMSTAVLFLSHTIPSNKFLMKKGRAVILCLFALIGMITAMSPYMFTHLEIQGTNIEPAAGPGMLMFLLTGLGYSISGIFILAKKYSKSKGLERKQLLFVLIGISIMHILLIAANFIIVLIFKSSYFISFGPFFTLPFLLSVAYAITRHRFMEIRGVVIRAITFTLLVILVVFGYANLLSAITNYAPKSNQVTLNIILILILAYTLNPIRKFLENSTVKIFFKKTYDSNILLDKLGNITTSTLSLPTITHKVLTTLSNTLQIEKSAFILLSESGSKVFQIGYDDLPNISKSSIKKISQKTNSDPLSYEDVSDPTLKQIFNEAGASVILPLEYSKTLHGVLMLGQKKSGDIFSNQDLQVLDIFAPQISVAIQNSLAYEKIRQFNRTLEQEVKDATSKLRIANKNLRHLDKIKDEFVFVATHELKNPVTAMKGYLSMINEGSFGKVPKNLSDPIEQLSQSNQQLVNLVNDLLQIARAEAHTLRVSVEPTNICSIIQTTIATIKPLAEQKNLAINYACGVNELMVSADPERLKEIFNNLLSNAIKYSEKGTINISLVEDKEVIIAHVKDEGYGIPQKDQARIFSRFFRVEEEAAKGIPGSGLGLFIVRQLVEKMNGKIWFTSKFGQGTTFSFSLPKA